MMNAPSLHYISSKEFEKIYKEKGLTGGRVKSPVGDIEYRILNGALCGIGFKDSPPIYNRLSQIFQKDYKVDEKIGQKVLDYLLNKQDFPIILIGTPFQHKVWQELKNIPSGQCVSYQAVAEKLGDIKKVRAVASAIGRNAISWAIPCHRVIPKQGGIGQYLWGIDIKAKLLLFEGYQTNAA